MEVFCQREDNIKDAPIQLKMFVFKVRFFVMGPNSMNDESWTSNTNVFSLLCHTMASKNAFKCSIYLLLLNSKSSTFAFFDNNSPKNHQNGHENAPSGFEPKQIDSTESPSAIFLLISASPNFSMALIFVLRF